MSEYEIRTIDAGSAIDLRTALLRGEVGPSGPEAADRSEGALHVGGFRGETLLGVASLHPQAMPGSHQVGAWRLRAVAVEHGHRGRGLGALLVERCAEHVALQDAAVLWCYTPAGSFGFFERQGFARHGDPIDLDKAPFYLAYAEVAPLDRSWAL